MRSAPLSLPLSLVLAAVGGRVTDLAFPDTGWWAMGFVGVALLFVALHRRRAWSSLVVGAVWGAAFFLFHITWVEVSVGWVPWVALSIAEALLVGLGCVAWSFASRARVVRRSPIGSTVVFGLIWTSTEVLRSGWPFGGFPWGRLAFSQADSPLGRLAWLGGPSLVSLGVAVVGALLGLAVLNLFRLQLGRAGGAVVVAFCLLLLGLVIPLSTKSENGFLNVGIVQGNVADPGLGSFANRFEVLGNHVQGTMGLLTSVTPGELDLVLWPENASDVDPRADARATDMIDTAARAVDAPILIGTQRYVPGGRFNEGAMWVPGKGIVQVYAKQHPAPFAEYVPMREFARKFSDAVDLVRTDMLAGSEPGVLTVPGSQGKPAVQIGDVICFEVAYDDVVRTAVSEGGQLLVVQTNNANFGYTAESTQQLAMARIRAIETGRATTQVSTVGVSAIIEPNGVVKQRTGLFTAESVVAKMPLRTTLTPAVRVGNLPSVAACVLAAFATLIGITSTVAGHAATGRLGAKSAAKAR